VTEGQRLTPYVPRLMLRHLAETPDDPVRHVDGTLLFADISGFTPLSERLARTGREGAERLAGAIGSVFAGLLEVAYANGGGLLKFAGDAILLLFEGEGHVERAAHAATSMRRTLREIGRIEQGGAKFVLRMSAGMHAATFDFFVAGHGHKELVIAGHPATAVMLLEKAARAGQILISDETAARLPSRAVGARSGPGRALRDVAQPAPPPPEPLHRPDAELIARLVARPVRERALSAAVVPEHRFVTVAFVRFSGLDELVRTGAASDILTELVDDVHDAAEEHGISLLSADLEIDGGKLMLAAGAPSATGEEDERMLLAMRRVLERPRPGLSVGIGVNRGFVFAGDIGPHYRRTYTTMGDAVNLAARLAAAAPGGELYATTAVVDHSSTRFAVTRMAPLRVKGKARPVEAFSVGAAIGSRSREAVLADRRFPLFGREVELYVLEEALVSAREGRGQLVEIVGEPGVGKSRLLEELRARAPDLQSLQATCEAYTASTAYTTWRDLLRQVLGAARDLSDEHMLKRLRAFIGDADPMLEPWIPLLAIPLGLHVPPTEEVASLDDANRRGKLHETVRSFLRSGLREPTLIEIEDAHLMDAASVELLAVVSEAASTSPWLITVTRRDVASGFIAAEDAHVRRIEPAPLSRLHATELARIATARVALAPAAIELAIERAGGNPQFLRDLLRAAALGGGDELPPSIEAAAVARIDRLPPGDRAIVRRAAVLGRTFDPVLLADILDEQDPRPDGETWARLRRYFEPDGSWQMRFRRQVVWEAAYAGLPFRTRRRLHAAAGARLEHRFGADAEQHATEIALHFARAGDAARAWRYARASGDGALRRLAPAEAVASYRMALDAARGVSPDEIAAVWTSLGEAHVETGELGSANRAFTVARRLVAGDPVREAGLLRRHAELAVEAGRIRPGVRWAMRGLRTLDHLRDGSGAAERARLTAMLATVRQRQGRADEAIALCREAIAAAEEADEALALAHACYVLDWALVESGRGDEAGHSQRALEIYRRVGDLGKEAAVLNNLGGFAYRDGRWDEALSLYLGGAAASGRSGNAANAAFGDCNVGEVMSDQGHWEEGESLLRRARQVWRGTGYEWGVAYAGAMLGRLAAREGRHGQAFARLLESAGRFRALGVLGDVELAEALLAEAAALAREPRSAAAAAARLLEAPDTGFLRPLLMRVLGAARAQLGAREGADEALHASLDAARELHEPYETLLSLDALCAFGENDVAGERDALAARLGVVRLAPIPLEPTAGRPGRPSRPEPASR
jgi:class 3 adenylate cyclase/tetratricopeptide (TPR) repeat protein